MQDNPEFLEILQTTIGVTFTGHGIMEDGLYLPL